MLYGAYLHYPRAFYDRHATGEVISRATNDIYPVRYFIGWGVVQAIQSVLMLVGAAIVLIAVNPRLALTAAVAMPPIAVLAYFFAHRVFPISREVQRKKGHLTEASDEAVVGIEMVQAFGREDDVRDRFGDRAEAVRHETMRQASVEAPLPARARLPPHARDRRRAARRRPRGDRRQSDDRRVHAVRDAPAPARLAARGARLDHQPRPARDRGRVAQLRVARRDRAAARARASGLAPRRPADRRLRRRPLPLPRRAARCSAGVDLEVAPGEIVAVCGATGVGQDVAAPTCCRASTTRRPARCRSAASTRATCRSPSSGAPSRSSRRSRCSSRSRCATTCSPRGPTPTGARCSTPARRPAWPSSSTTCRTATTR